MSKFKSSILGVLGLIAAGELSANVDGCCLNYGYNRPLTNQGSGFFGYVDYLYLQADMRLFWESRILSKKDFNDVSMKQTPYDWNSGFRVGVGYGLPCNQWALLFDWMHLDTKVSRHDEAINLNELSDSAGPKIQTSKEVIPGIGFVQQPLDFFSDTRIEFNSSLCYDDLNLYLGKEYYVGRSVLFAPFAGVKALFIHTSVQDDFYGVPTNHSFPAYSQLFRATDNFTGVGLMAGMKSSWALFSGLFVYAKGSASLLVTGSHIHLRDENQNPFFAPLLDFRNRFHELTYTFDGSLGFRWNQSLQCDQMILSAHVGWEGHYISDQNRLPVPNNPLSVPSKPLTIHGLVVGFGIDL